MSRRPIPEEEEEIDDDFEMDDEEDEGVDMLGLFTTDEGETVAMSLSGLKDATEKIAASLDMQNKILLKILSELKTGRSGPAPSDSA